MNRRQFLVSTTVGMGFVTGCSQNPDTASSPQPTTPPAPTREPSELSTATPTESADSHVIYVAPDGANENEGTEQAPLQTIDRALDLAMPGQTIYVKPGQYREGAGTVRGGEPGRPITITGPPDAVFRGGLGIEHSHIHVRGLSFDGLRDQESPDKLESYAYHNLVTNPIYDPDEETFGGYIEDIVFKPHTVGNTRSSCISFQYANDVEIGEFEVIGPAGLVHLIGDNPGHNGEIIYIGRPFTKWLDPTQPESEQLDIDKFPVDESHNYHIHHIKQTGGHPHTEIVDAKQGTYDVLIEYVTDVGASGYYRLHDEKPPSDEASMNLGGTDATLRWSIIEDGRGAGVIVGNSGLVSEMDELVEFPDDRFPGTNNSVYGNRLLNNEGLAISFHSIRHDAAFDNGPEVQDVICSNEYNGETMGEPNRECGDSIPVSDRIGHLGGDSPWA